MKNIDKIINNGKGVVSSITHTQNTDNYKKSIEYEIYGLVPNIIITETNKYKNNNVYTSSSIVRKQNGELIYTETEEIKYDECTGIAISEEIKTSFFPTTLGTEEFSKYTKLHRTSEYIIADSKNYSGGLEGNYDGSDYKVYLYENIPNNRPFDIIEPIARYSIYTDCNDILNSFEVRTLNKRISYSFEDGFINKVIEEDGKLYSCTYAVKGFNKNDYNITDIDIPDIKRISENLYETIEKKSNIEIKVPETLIKSYIKTNNAQYSINYNTNVIIAEYDDLAIIYTYDSEEFNRIIEEIYN